MTLFTAIINLANGYGFDVTAEESPIRVAPLESGTAAEVTVTATGQSFVVTGETINLAAMASLFHSVSQHQRSIRLLSQAVSAAAPMPEWAA
jgi:hypothetical protein